jgi:GTP cyclohydrolase I
MEIDVQRIENAVREILLALGEDPTRTDIRDTPRRVGRMYKEIFAGLERDPADVLTVFLEQGFDEMVVVKDIPMYSICEHHLLPFVGKAHVAYIPQDGRVTGLSKLARIVEGYSRRLQVQERLTTQIADALMSRLKPQGVLVVVEAEHLCMTMRGVQKPGAVTVTSVVRGLFRENESTRAEALALIRARK